MSGFGIGGGNLVAGAGVEPGAEVLRRFRVVAQGARFRYPVGRRHPDRIVAAFRAGNDAGTGARCPFRKRAYVAAWRAGHATAEGRIVEPWTPGRDAHARRVASRGSLPSGSAPRRPS